jgi:WD40 repeat protein
MPFKLLKASLPVTQAHFATDKALALLVLNNGTMEGVSLADGKKVKEWSPKGIPPPYAMQREGNWVIGRGPDGGFRGTHVGEDTIAFTTKAIPGSVGRVAIAPNGKFIAVAYSDARLIRLFETANGQQTAEFEDGVGGSSLLMVSPDHRYLVAAAFDATMRVFDLGTKKVVMEDRQLPMALWAGAFGKDADTYCLYAGSTDARLYRFRHGHAEKGPEILAKGLPANVNQIGTFGDGSVITAESNPAGNSLPVVARYWSGPKMEPRVVADLPKTATHIDANPYGPKTALISDGTNQVRLVEVG